jgi:hypothetical protein
MSKPLLTVIGARQIVFSVWVTLSEQKWVVLRERRGSRGQYGSQAPVSYLFCPCLRMGMARVHTDGDFSRAASMDSSRHFRTDHRCARHA